MASPIAPPCPWPRETEVGRPLAGEGDRTHAARPGIRPIRPLAGIAAPAPREVQIPGPVPETRVLEDLAP